MKNQPDRSWDWLQAVLLIAAMLASAGRLAVTSWTPQLETVEVMAGLGALLGLLLGYSRFGRRGTWLLSAGYGLVTFPWILGWVDTPHLPATERMLSMGGRLAFAVGQLSRGQPVEDHIFFITLAALLFWIVAVSGGYMLQRHANLLAALLPAGLIVLFVQGYDSYYSRRIGFVAVFLFLALALGGRVYYLKQRGAWQEKKVYIAAEANSVMANGIVAAALVVVLLAFTLPTTPTSLAVAANAWKQLTQPWRTMQDDLSDAFAALKSTVAVTREFYGDVLPLGNTVPEGDALIFRVSILEKPYQPARLYWRGRVYDKYERGQWVTTQPASTAFDPPRGDLVTPEQDNPDVMRLRFQNGSHYLQMVYTTAQPLWISRPGSIEAYKLPNNELDLVLFSVNPLIAPGEVFETRAAIHNPTVAQLRAAGTEYPAWVTDRYLDLPRDFSPRLRQVAADAAAEAGTPYDQTALVTYYLRQEVSYATSVPNAPFGRDPLEWVILDHKQAFCNYYATAEVLMLRSLGIPARMALGYSQGTYDSKSEQYAVRQGNFHAWPEVYFPGIGWVEFEPTANQDPIFRSSGDPIQPNSGPDDPILEELLAKMENRLENRQNDNTLPLPADETPQSPSGPSLSFNWQPMLRTLGWMLAIGLVTWLWLLEQRQHFLDKLPGVVKLTLEKRNINVPRWLERWAFYTSLNPVARAYRVIPLSLAWLGQPPAPSDTPAEHTEKLGKLLPQTRFSIKNLLAEYQKSAYSPEPGDMFLARRSSRIILQAATRARVQLLLQSFRKILSER